jgi:hypothetical protein
MMKKLLADKRHPVFDDLDGVMKNMLLYLPIRKPVF